MAFDFDPFSHLDLNADLEIYEHELKMHHLQEGHGYSIDDLNNDNINDKFQNSLNGNLIPDQFEVDLDKNAVIDQFETLNMGAKLTEDISGDGNVDEADEAVARYLFPKT